MKKLYFVQSILCFLCIYVPLAAAGVNEEDCIRQNFIVKYQCTNLKHVSSGLARLEIVNEMGDCIALNSIALTDSKSTTNPSGPNTWSGMVGIKTFSYADDLICSTYKIKLHLQNTHNFVTQTETFEYNFSEHIGDTIDFAYGNVFGSFSILPEGKRKISTTVKDYTTNERVCLECAPTAGCPFPPQFSIWEYKTENSDHFVRFPSTSNQINFHLQDLKDVKPYEKVIFRTLDERNHQNANEASIVLRFFPSVPQPITHRADQFIKAGYDYLDTLSIVFDRPLNSDLEEKLTKLTIYSQIDIRPNGLYDIAEGKILTVIPLPSDFSIPKNCMVKIPLPILVRLQAGNYFMTVEGSVRNVSNNYELFQSQAQGKALASIEKAMFKCTPFEVKKNAVQVRNINIKETPCWDRMAQVSFEVPHNPYNFFETVSFFKKQSDRWIPFDGFLYKEKGGTTFDVTSIYGADTIGYGYHEFKIEISNSQGISDGLFSMNIPFIDTIKINFTYHDISGIQYENKIPKSSQDGWFCVSPANVTNATPPYHIEYCLIENLITDTLTEDTVHVPEPTVFMLHLRDKNGCTANDGWSIDILDDTLKAEIVQTDFIHCAGENTAALEAKIYSKHLYHITWYKNGIIYKTQTPYINQLGPGHYKLEVKQHSTSLVSFDEITIQSPAPLQLTAEKVDVNCFGMKSGRIDYLVSGGTPPYITTCNTVICPSSSIQNLEASTYLLQTRDDKGCLQQKEIKITQPEQPLKIVLDSIAHSFKNSHGIVEQGRVYAHVCGGTPPYTKLFTDSDTSEPTLQAGIYHLQTRDQKECTYDTSFEIQYFDRLEVRLNLIQEILCFGDSTASCELEILHGIPPYQIEWEDGSSIPNRTQLKAGTYRVKVRDSYGNTDTASIEITQPNALKVNTIKARQPSYSYYSYGILSESRSDGELSALVEGGRPPYFYTWTLLPDQNLTDQHISNHIGGLDSGFYHLKITDQNQCETFDSILLIKKSPLKAILRQKAPILCSGGETDIEAIVDGGTPPYTYSWNDRLHPISDLGGVKSGTYLLEVCDSMGVISTESIEIIEPAPISIDSLNLQSPSYMGSIYGDTLPIAPNAFIEAVGKGGTPPYTYTWFSDSIELEENSPLLSNVKNGFYKLRISDKNHCLNERNFHIPHIPNLYSKIRITDSNYCPMDQRASLQVDVHGGTPPYTFLWSTSDTTERISNLNSQTFFVQVKDRFNITSLDSFHLARPDSIQIMLQGQDPSCHEQSDGKINARIQFGNLPFHLKWKDACNRETEKQIFSRYDSLELLPAGKTSLELVDDKGCRSYAELMLQQPSPIRLQIHTSPPSYQGSYYKKTPSPIGNGQIHLFIDGGTPPYQIRCNDRPVSVNIDTLYSGSYTLQVSDRNSCRLDTVIQLLPPSNLYLELALKQGSACFGDSTAGISAFVNGGTPPYRFKWMKGNEYISSSPDSLTHLEAGEYTAIVTDALGIEAIDSIFILSPLPLNLDGKISHETSWKASNGKIELTIEGGTSPYRILWDNGEETMQREFLTRGTYRVLLRDHNNCSLTRSYDIESPDSLQLEHWEFTETLPFKSTAKLYATIRGGIRPYQIRVCSLEATPTTIYSNDTMSDSDFKLNNLAFGNYELSVKDAAQDSICQKFQIDSSENLKFRLEIAEEVQCYNSATASLQALLWAGLPPYHLQCLHVETDSLIFSSTTSDTIISLYHLQHGTYQVTAADLSNEPIVKSICLDNPTPMSCSHELVPIERQDSNYDAVVQLHIQGGKPPYTHRWIHGDSNLQIGIFRGQSYGLDIWDSKNCFHHQDFVFEIPNSLQSKIQELQSVSCYGKADAKLHLEIQGGSPPYQIRWKYQGEWIDSLHNQTTLKNLGAGIYQAFITDRLQYEDHCIFKIEQPLPLRAKYHLQPPLCHGEENGSIQVQMSGGRYPYSYEWSNQMYSANIFQIPAATYTLMVVDQNSCSFSDTIVLRQPSPLSCSVEADHPICPEDKGKIEINVSGGSSGYKVYFNYEKVEFPFVVEDVEHGIYFLSILDSNRCETDTFIHILRPRQLRFELNDIAYLCPNQEIKISPFNFNSTAELQYEWLLPNNKFSTDSCLLTQDSGWHQLKITQFDRCEYIDSIYVQKIPDSIYSVFWISSVFLKGEKGIAVNICPKEVDSSRWLIPEHVEITDMDDNFIELLFLEPGSYTIGLEAFLGQCSEITETQVEVLDSEFRSRSSLSETSSIFHVHIRPNPSRGDATIRLHSSERTSANFKLISAHANSILYTQKMELDADTEYLWSVFPFKVPKGLYFFIIESPLENKVIKVIHL